MNLYQFSARIERDKDTGMYVAYVPALAGAHTQANSLKQLRINLKEVIELCLEEMSDRLLLQMMLEAKGEETISADEFRKEIRKWK